MEFLNQCELLKIEDILPFFQDFVTIDHFKVRFPAACIFFHNFIELDYKNYTVKYPLTKNVVTQTDRIGRAHARRLLV